MQPNRAGSGRPARAYQLHRNGEISLRDSGLLQLLCALDMLGQRVLERLLIRDSRPMLADTCWL